MNALEHLAREGHFIDQTVAEAAQRAMSRRADLHQALAENPDLTPSVWSSVYHATSDVKVAKLLVNRELDTTRRAEVLVNERREGVLAAFVTANALTDDELARIPLTRRKGRLAEAIVNAGWADTDTRVSLVARVGLVDRIKLACDPRVALDAASVASWFTGPVWDQPVKSKSARSAALSMLLYTHPELTGVLLSSGHDAAVTAVAGSPAITAETMPLVVNAVIALGGESRRYALLSLAANPRVDTPTLKSLASDNALLPLERSEVLSMLTRRVHHDAITGPYDSVDETTLHRLLRRAMPSQYRPSGRPAELMALLDHPRLGTRSSDVTAALASLTGHPVWSNVVCARLNAAIPEQPAVEFEVVPAGDLSHYFNWNLPSWLYPTLAVRTSEAFGGDHSAWDTFISLYDTFTGDLAELIGVARTV